MLSTISLFIEHLEELMFKEELIYRSILVTKNDKESSSLKKELQKKDYSVQILDDRIFKPNEIYNVDYNELNTRIIIMTYNKFKNFIEYIDEYNGGILQSSFNMIGFSYLIPDKIHDDLLLFYINKTNNNITGTLFLDKTIAKFLYLKNIVA